MQLEYMLLLYPEDRLRIATHVSEFEQYTPAQLVDHYNRQVELGILCAREQAISLAALALVFRRVFGESPVYAKEGVIALQGRIHLHGNRFHFLEPDKLKQ